MTHFPSSTMAGEYSSARLRQDSILIVNSHLCRLHVALTPTDSQPSPHSHRHPPRSALFLLLFLTLLTLSQASPPTSSTLISTQTMSIFFFLSYLISFPLISSPPEHRKLPINSLSSGRSLRRQAIPSPSTRDRQGLRLGSRPFLVFLCACRPL